MDESVIVGIARDLNAAATIIVGCAARLSEAIGPDQAGAARAKPDPRTETFEDGPVWEPGPDEHPDRLRLAGRVPPEAETFQD